MYKLFALFFSLVLLVGVSAFVFADDDQVYELDDSAFDVQTDHGFIDLEEGTLIGGDSEEYISLTSDVLLSTTSGQVLFSNGTRIRCNVPPGHPNPCNPYG